MIGRSGAAAGLVCLVSFSAAELFAQAPDRFVVVLAGCVDPSAAHSPPVLDAGALETALKLELEAEGVTAFEFTRERSAAATRAEIELPCEGTDEIVDVRLMDTRTEGARRTVDVSELPRPSRARAVAVVVAEMSRAVWFRAGHPRPLQAAEHDTSATSSAPETAVAPQGEHVNPPDESASTPSGRARAPVRAPKDRVWRVGGSAVARVFVPTPTALFGGEISGEHRRARLALEASWGGLRSSSGLVRFGLASAQGAYEVFAWSGTGQRLSLGPSVQLGAAWARGHSRTRSATSGDAWEPFAEMGPRLAYARRLSRAFQLQTAASFSYAYGLSVRAQGEDVAALAGVGGRLSLGVAGSSERRTLQR
jgi:hypothetical protein